MNKFLSGMGMGMVAGACLGMAAAGMVTDADRRRMNRTAQRAVQTVEDAAESLGILHR